MKLFKANILLAGLVVAGVFSSCDDFLDKNPDDRATVDSYEKINNLLTTAYSPNSANFILELSSDNVMDNGKAYNTAVNQEEIYRWKAISTEGNDDPRYYWQNTYKAIATANQALSSIKELGDGEAYQDLKAEALLCRAYGMFSLAKVFCMSYNPDKAEEYLGLPYPLEPEQDINAKYKRGTLKELYEKIDADIEAALPYVSDTHFAIPKYHFNTKAAYAFAARFNLYYMNYDKAIKYATQVLGNNPANLLRDFSTFMQYSNPSDIDNAYIASKVNANLMLQTGTSLAGRWSQGTSSMRRFHHNVEITTYETFWVEMPWGKGSKESNNCLYQSRFLFGTNQAVYFPKMLEHFEYTDKISGTGYTHIVDAVFTSDETLLVRAEAYAMKKDYASAIADMNTWISNHCISSAGYYPRPTLTEESINAFIENLSYAEPTAVEKARSIRKKFNPQGFTVEAGTQENILEMILQMRRIETMYQGMRFLDLKRYGIEFGHPIEGEDTQVFKAGDLRGAIQLPNDVINAGIEANPR